jgi:hypothetical protein
MSMHKQHPGNLSSEYKFTQPVRRAPNVFFGERVGYNDTAPAEDSDIMKVTLKLAKTNPSWTFSVTRRTTGFHIANVFHQNEHLGDYYTQAIYNYRTYTNECGFCVSSPGIKKKMRRKACVETSDPARAYRAIASNFTTTPEETRVRNRVLVLAPPMLRTAGMNRSYTTDTDLDPMAVLEFLTSKALWSEFSAFVASKGGPVDLKTSIPARAKQAAASSQLYAAAARDKLVAVAQTDSEYWLFSYDSSTKCVPYEPPRVTSLPDEFRGKVGLLKLSECDAIVPDVGVRLSDDTFLVIKE